MRRLPTRRGNEQGSATIEAAIGLPALALFIGLIIFAGRTAVAHQAVESAAADAARAASLSRSATDAGHDADQAARASLANQQLNCRSVSVDVDTDAFGLPVGEYALVEVAVECVLDLSDLSVPGIPGRHVVTAEMSSPLDAWRERSTT